MLTQARRELPMGGINEKGIASKLMWLDETVFQLQMPVLPSMNSNGLVVDTKGNKAVIEFIDGKQVPYKGQALQVLALTNNFYAASLEFLQEYPSPQKILFRFIALCALQTIFTHSITTQKRQA